MKETKWKMHSLVASGIFLILVSLTACQKTEYDLLDPETAGVWTLYNTENSVLPANEISDIKVSEDGKLWVAFSYNGAGVLSEGSWTFYNSTNGLIRNSVKTLEACSNGNMMFGTSDGLSIRTAYGQWSSYKDPSVTTMYINTIKEMSNGLIWIGTKGQGYYVYDGSTYSHYLVTGFENVNVITEDKYGNLWMGTNNGLIVRVGTNWQLWTTTSGLSDNLVNALYYDNQDRMWIGYGTENVYEVTYYDYSKDILTAVYLFNGLGGVDVRDIQQDRNGDFWFALWWDGLIKYDGVIAQSYKKYNGFFDDYNAIEEDLNGDLWFGTDGNGLYKYTLPLDKN
ncbi:MAG: hypothetical protein NTZ85_03970 [Bacteroidia bacterium]|nr:hypothetical protein [Bacteroidia bacterium]